MNQGGEPGHDDYGLPHVDIEVPDDARELYRDVQAYHRELRALRRHQRSRRLRAPLDQPGMALPLIAGCIVLALIAGMVVTMFGANLSGITGRAPSNSAASGGSSRASKDSTSAAGSGSRAASAAPSVLTAPPQAARAQPLPGKTISVQGKPVLLSSIKSTALAIVPANCRCGTAVRQLLFLANLARVAVYLIGSRGITKAALARLADDRATGRRAPFVAIDMDHVLTSEYQPVGLTVLLVDAGGMVTIDAKLHPGPNLEKQLQSLKPSG